MKARTESWVAEKADELFDGRRSWFGYLTLENAEAVTEAIRELLEGRLYTWVAVNEGLDLLNPEVRTAQRLAPEKLDDGKAVTLRTGSLSDGREHAHIAVVDSYGVWGMSTTIPDQRAANSTRGPVGLHHMCDPELEGKDYGHVYVEIERDRELRVKQRTLAGGRITWVIAVEEENP